MTEEVSVIAETPLLETATATRSQVIDQAKVESLPHVGPQPLRPGLHVSGVTTQFTRESISCPSVRQRRDGRDLDQRRRRRAATSSCSTARRTRAARAASQGSLAFVPSPDAVQEVRVSTNTYDAQFGRTGGGVIAVSIRSGTNTVSRHRLLQPSRRVAEQQPLREQRPRHPEGGPVPLQPGLHLRRSGRLPKYDGTDKTFFFYAFEGLKSGIPVSSGERAPTDLERAGDFSQSGATIYDPLTTSTACRSRSRAT